MATQGSQVTRKEIILHLRPSGHLWDGVSGVSWLEGMLGVVAGRDDLGTVGSGVRNDEEKVFVKGLVAEGPASKSKELFLGEYFPHD
jgi:hypothetical protein